jgi:hypothetical protein
MHEDHRDTQDATEIKDSHDEYVAPKLNDLGSFEELTQLSTGPNPDSEGTS